MARSACRSAARIIRRAAAISPPARFGSRAGSCRAGVAGPTRVLRPLARLEGQARGAPTRERTDRLVDQAVVARAARITSPPLKDRAARQAPRSVAESAAGAQIRRAQ